MVTTLVPSFLIFPAHLTPFLLFYAYWAPVSSQLCYHLCTTCNLKNTFSSWGPSGSSNTSKKSFFHPSYLDHELSSYCSTNTDLFSPVHGSSGFPMILFFWDYSEICLPSCVPETEHHNSGTKTKIIPMWSLFPYRS